MSQNAMILAHIKKGRAIDALTALSRYGIMRLASRIYDLRMMGHDIHAIKREVHKRNGEIAKICIYKLMPKKRK